MSKASEWASGFAKRPNFVFVEGFIFEVANSGDLNICPKGSAARTLSPSDAIAVARWILDVFSEPVSGEAP